MAGELGAPARGTVIRYSYLWHDKFLKGASEGDKERPCLVVSLPPSKIPTVTMVVVCPITHIPPARPDDAVIIPEHICRAVGLSLDGQRVVIAEADWFNWPGFDVRKVPGKDTHVYGKVPDEFLEQVLIAIRARKEPRMLITDRRT